MENKNVECFIIHSLWWCEDKICNSYFTRQLQSEAEKLGLELIAAEIEDDVCENGDDSPYANAWFHVNNGSFSAANSAWQRAQERSELPICCIFITFVSADCQGIACEGDYRSQCIPNPMSDTEALEHEIL